MTVISTKVNIDMFSYQALHFSRACKINCLALQKVFITVAVKPLRFSVTKLLVANNIPHIKLISQHLPNRQFYLAQRKLSGATPFQ